MLCFLIANKKERFRLQHDKGPIVLGRAPNFSGTTHAIQDEYCSAHQLHVQELPGRYVRVSNMSTRVRVELADGSPLDPGVTAEYRLPIRLVAGKTTIEIAAEVPPQEESGSLTTIARPIALGYRSAFDLTGLHEDRTRLAPSTDWPSVSLTGVDDATGMERLTRWFETLVTVQRATASSDAFFQETARAVVDLIGLDCGLILSRRHGEWKTEACHPPRAFPLVTFSQSVLDLVVQERRTYFRNTQSDDVTTSLSGISTFVASPIFAQDGVEVVGAVYGVRFALPSPAAVEMSPLEAQLVQVLAAAVGAGLCRRESEMEAARRHVQFEQFFSRELARELDRDPSLLEGREREVSILVSDIRGFSRIAEQLGPRETCLMMNDVLGRLTARILDQGGVVVDYVGDGIMAMWNAPVDQPDHGARASRAALAMLGELPALNDRWRDRIKETLALGIGINTGTALVGNTGSPQKFKYGPLGHTVNLASRVEGATKQLGVPILITGTTHERLAGAFATRRLVRARVVGIVGEVDLHELHAAEIEPEWRSRRETYEEALAFYESGQWTEACRALYPLLAGQEGRFDLPTLNLVGRAIECLKAKPRVFDPVVDLTIK